MAVPGPVPIGPSPATLGRLGPLEVRLAQTKQDVKRAQKLRYRVFYKDGTAIMNRWKMDRAGTPPIDVPFHPGAIKYLKEKDIWTDEMQAWNDKRLARLNALRAACKDAVAEGEGESDEAFAKIWETHRQKALDSL